MDYRTRIEDKLTRHLEPVRLRIKDVSHRHAGHAHRRVSDAPEGGETHFSVEVVSARFEGMARLARHRLVNELLADELKERVHALQLRTLTPAEDAAAADNRR